MDDTATHVGYEFERFRLDPRRRRLTRLPDAEIAVTAKAFDALLYLVEHAGSVVTRDALVRELWPNRVVEENNLNQTIAAIRRALGDDHHEHRYVVTIPGRGYQFVWDVRRCGLAPSQPEGIPAPVDVDPSLEQERAAPSAAPAPERLNQPADRLWVAAVILLAAVASWTAWSTLGPAPLPGEWRLEIVTPPTSDPWSLAISPDGRAVVFVALGDGGSQLWLRRLDADEALPLAGTHGAFFPFWSPDGRSLAFFSQGLLKRLDLDGGEIRTLAGVTPGDGGTWSRNGTILFSASRGGPILRVSAQGGAPEAVTQLDTPREQNHSSPQFLPDGRTFLYYAQAIPAARGVYAARLGDPVARRVLDADAPAVYAASGHLLFVRNSTLYAQRFDASRIELRGEAFVVATPVLADSGPNHSALDASPAGAIAYRRAAADTVSRLAWFDREGSHLGFVGAPQTPRAMSPSLSPDETLIALYRMSGGNTDVWLLDAVQGMPSRFTYDPAFDNTPVWSPDGLSIVFASNRRGALDLYRKSVAQGGEEDLLLSSPRNKVPTDWSSDGRYLLFRVTADETSYDIYALPMEGDGEPVAVAVSPFDEREAQFSPDGTWVAFQSNESGRFEIYVQSFPEPGRKRRVSVDGGSQARWSADGTELFYIARDHRLMAVPVEVVPGGQEIRSGTPQPLFSTSTLEGPVPYVDVAQYAVSADGQRFLMNMATEPAVASITLLMNWAPD